MTDQSKTTTDMPDVKLAKLFHETYERLAPQFGYKTREESAKPWDEVPEQNKQLMIAVCGQVINKFSVYQEALEKLSRLGNGDRLGNSEGNRIAQQALGYTNDKWNTRADLVPAAPTGDKILDDKEASYNAGYHDGKYGTPCEQVRAQQQSDDLVKALGLAIEVLEIASDWNAPSHYEVKVPEGYQDAIDPESEEPEWIALYLLLPKLKKLLATHKAKDTGR